MNHDQETIPQAQTPLKIAVIGATGNIGRRIVAEAIERGHRVTGIARRPETLELKKGLTRKQGDANDPEKLSSLLTGHDAVVSSIHFLDSDIVLLVGAVRAAGVNRYVVVGGAGSLEVAPGKLNVNEPDFPAFAKTEATKGVAVLDYLRTVNDLDWTFLSPSAMIIPGKRTGIYRLGKDQLLVGADGKSWISMEDYAAALIDEIETPRNTRARFTVGY